MTDLFIEEDRSSAKASYKWWQGKRWLFNMVVGLAGIIGMQIFIGYIPLNQVDIIGIIFYGITANICYFAGYFLESLVRKFNPGYDFVSRRWNIFWAATSLSAIGTIILARWSNSMY
jgi:hypothetical protein